MGGERETIRAIATVTLDARTIEELGPETIDRLADRVEARLVRRAAAGAEPLMTATAAAELAGAHAETVRRAIRGGVIEVAGYVGTRPRVRRQAVELWIAAGRRPATDASGARRVVSTRRRGPVRRVLGDALQQLDGEGRAA